MLVNSIDIANKYKGNINILNEKIKERNIVTYTDWSDNSLDLTIQRPNRYKEFEIYISMLLTGNSMNECEMIRSQLLKEFKCGEIKLDEMSITHDFIIKSESITFLNKWRYLYELTLTAYNKKGTQETINFTGTTKTFTAKGTADTMAVLSLSSNIGLNSLTITGLTQKPITVQNIAINTPITIDGEKCIVEENGKNIFGRTDLWEFPTIKPGQNTITLSSACVCALTYKPRYL